ncbi:MAG TPA: hypothetical protein VN811_12835 [Thermoanaerobaculia bacterium]|nr:hypothetical protein [Thermoanaerobaculia bacterium]
MYHQLPDADRLEEPLPREEADRLAGGPDQRAAEEDGSARVALRALAGRLAHRPGEHAQRQRLLALVEVAEWGIVGEEVKDALVEALQVALLPRRCRRAET